MKRAKIELLIGLILMVGLSAQVFANESSKVTKEIVVRGNFGSAEGEFGHKIFEDGSWAEPSAIAIDSKGNIYIADPLNHRVQKFGKEGKYLTKIIFEDQDKTLSFTISDLAIDSEDNLYILEPLICRIICCRNDLI
jgi:tripartite motif-containing protein 71